MKGRLLLFPSYRFASTSYTLRRLRLEAPPRYIHRVRAVTVQAESNLIEFFDLQHATSSVH